MKTLQSYKYKRHEHCNNIKKSTIATDTKMGPKPLSDPTAYRSYKKEKDLIDWLSHHNPEVYKKLKMRSDGKQYTRSLLTALKSERNAKDKMESLVKFVSSYDEEKERKVIILYAEFYVMLIS